MPNQPPNPDAPHFNVLHDGPLVHVSFPGGHIDGTAVTKLSAAAGPLIAGPQTRVLLDLSGIDFVSSGAVGLMISLKRTVVAAGARMHLAVPSARVRETFRVMRLEVPLAIYPTVEAATAAFAA